VAAIKDSHPRTHRMMDLLYQEKLFQKVRSERGSVQFPIKPDSAFEKLINGVESLMEGSESTKQKKLFLCWVPNQSRSESLSLYLGAECYYTKTYFRARGRFLRYILSPPRYVVQGVESLIALMRIRPNLIFVPNPPIFASVVAFVYCLFTNARFVTDTHTAAFDRTRWRCFLWLYRYLGRRALTNILHNTPLEDKVASWGLPTFCIGDFPFYLNSNRNYHFKKGFNIVVVCIFDQDEPISEVIEATSSLPEVNFYVTGSLKDAPRQVLENKPSNVLFTDFLPFEEYIALLKGSDVVVSLTTKDFTLQNGALEALELERPVITSNWPVLRKVFNKGTIHIDNTAAGLVSAINDMRNRHNFYINDIKLLKNDVNRKWQKQFKEFSILINS